MSCINSVVADEPDSHDWMRESNPDARADPAAAVALAKNLRSRSAVGNGSAGSEPFIAATCLLNLRPSRVSTSTVAAQQSRRPGSIVSSLLANGARDVSASSRCASGRWIRSMVKSSMFTCPVIAASATAYCMLNLPSRLVRGAGRLVWGMRRGCTRISMDEMSAESNPYSSRSAIIASKGACVLPQQGYSLNTSPGTNRFHLVPRPDSGDQSRSDSPLNTAG